MPFVLIVFGTVLLIAAVRGDACGQMQCHEYLFYLLANDFTGPNNFVYWFLSILIVGAIGYVPKLKPVSDGLLIVIILGLFLSKGTGFVDMFKKQLAAIQSDKPVITGGNAGPATGTNVNVGIGLGGGGVAVGSGGVNIGLPTGSGGVTVGLPTGHY